VSTEPYESDLDDWLDDQERPPDYYESRISDQGETVGNVPEGLRPPWKITDDGAADWALRKLLRAKAEVDKIRLMAQDRIDTIRQWQATVSGPPIGQVAHWRGLLEEYALRRRQETGKPSVKLPNGTLATTEHKATVEITSPEHLLAWLGKNLPLREVWCKITVEPQVSRLKDQVLATVGSVCDRCGHHLVMGWTHPPLTDPPPRAFERKPVWRDAEGYDCRPLGDLTQTGMPHRPRADEEGEVLEVPVIVWQKDPEFPVPGLGVREQSTTARVVGA
jgi:hypothetical protein